MTKDTDASSPVIIKKYANRRLYHTGQSGYVTLEAIAQMVRDGEEFVVQDAKTGEDITRSVLTQIIFDQENKTGESLLPTSFLRQLIGLYNDNMSAVVPSFLDMSLNNFMAEQEKIRSMMTGSFPANGFEQIENQTKQNIHNFQEAMKMFNPFASFGVNPFTGESVSNQGEKTQAKKDTTGSKTDLQDLKNELVSLQKKLDAMDKD